MEAFKANLRLFFLSVNSLIFDLNYHSTLVNLVNFAMGRDEKYLRGRLGEK